MQEGFVIYFTKLVLVKARDDESQAFRTLHVVAVRNITTL